MKSRSSLYYVRCGRKNCKCMNTDYRHGPYVYNFYGSGGKKISKYVGKADNYLDYLKELMKEKS